MIAVLLCVPPVQGRELNNLVRPKIGLVLSGGGAKGAAHVGVIRVLENMGVPVDLVVGTSMGAIVGGLYASGLSGEELENAVLQIDWEDIFDDDPPRAERSLRRKRDDADFLVRYRLGLKHGEPQLPQGVILGQKLMLALRKLSARGARSDFDDLAHPFRAVATDLESGEPVVLSSGSLALAMRASMSVPGVFPPVNYDGRLLIDGGVANNLPIDVARAMGADIVIAVNVQTGPKPREKLRSVISIVDQTINLLILRESRRQVETLDDNDLLIEPSLGEIGSGDFLRMEEAIKLGESAALNAKTRLEFLAKLERTQPLFATERGAQTLPVDTPVISSIQIDNDSPLADDLLRARIRARVGEPLDLDVMEEDISKIYGLGHFDTVDYQLVGRRYEGNLLVTARQKDSGLNTLRFGLNLESDFAGESAFNIGLNYDVTAVNSLGAEWRNELVFGDRLKLATEFYQPLGYTSKWFVEPQVAYEEENGSLFDDGKRLALFRMKTALLGLDVGREFGSCCEARLGFGIGRGQIEMTNGTLVLTDDEYNIGAFLASLTYDTLDSVRFPRQGTLAFIGYTDSNEMLGADTAAQLVGLGALKALSWGPNTVFGQLSLEVNIDESAQVQDLFNIGGFLNLSGFTQDELSGDNAALTSLVYYRRVSGGGGEVLDIPIYLGGSIEYGGVFKDIGNFTSSEGITAGSLFFGADTPVGPLYIGYGMAEGGNRAAYLFLGQTF